MHAAIVDVTNEQASDDADSQLQTNINETLLLT